MEKPVPEATVHQRVRNNSDGVPMRSVAVLKSCQARLGDSRTTLRLCQIVRGVDAIPSVPLSWPRRGDCLR